jgi:hypothetical protein
MEILNSIPFSLNLDALMQQAHIEPGSDDAREFRALADVAMQAGKPKAVYTMSFVERRDHDTVQISGISFTSRTLSRNLQSVERVFPMVATCGHEMDEAAPAKGDILKDFWWDLIKTHVLGAAHKHLDEQLHRRFRLGKTAAMRPGSGDATVWPIEQQRGLFALLGDVRQAIGVVLTDSFLMVPNKTTSGILFPTEQDFRSCEVCHRENCPSRHAQFNKQLWEEIRQS